MSGVMVKYQYMGTEHTYVRLVEKAEKVRVNHGEVVESEREPKYFARAGFKELGVEKEEYQQKKEALAKAQKDFEKAREGSDDKVTMTIAEAKTYCEKNSLTYHPRTGEAKIIKLALDHQAESNVTAE